MKVFLRGRSWAAVVLVLVLMQGFWGCCHAPLSVAVVREQDFRIERLPLPLTPSGRDAILSFLKAGGDRERIGRVLVDPGAEARWDGWLKLLQDEKFLVESNFRRDEKSLKPAEALKPWFTESLTYQCVDATLKRPATVDPLALTDGTYWWILYRERVQGGTTFRMVGIVVTRVVERAMKEY